MSATSTSLDAVGQSSSSNAVDISEIGNRQTYKPPVQTTLSPLFVSPQYLSGGRKSLSGISIRAYGLGIALGSSLVVMVQLAWLGYGIWRAPFFVAMLAIFHYLEFDMTARYNPPDAQIASFLLLANGIAYTAAHTVAMAEVCLRYWPTPISRPQWLQIPFGVPQILPENLSWTPVALGLFLSIMGQYVRSRAMKEAKTNFNHIVQSTKNDDHVLIKSGVYAFCRHPSYFGFFWWGMGTQLVLGNKFCLVIYAVVLWKFFSHRIRYEERHLVSFFGQEYIDYRQRTPVLIPFVA